MRKILLLLLALSAAMVFAWACNNGDDDDNDDNDTSIDDDNDTAVDDDDDDDDNDDNDDNDDDNDDNDDNDTTPTPPEYPNNHDVTWNCYTCHASVFMGVTTKEPHNHAYTAPGQCVGCHQEGDFTNPPYEGGHNWNQNCLLCHAGKHGKTWQSKNECLVCHGE
ncbi:MAG: hypothetical protein GX444_07260 [Myxococcales bacterium]|nr:hypothetical protein [Myxococcales bacterium]